ncbi:MAG: transcriptional repressor [Nitrospina sp.]|jgi:Fur family transcriptional regulator, ferric uptake regulator|nr:transcriptional repressor [Nitrospina sp.]MBT5633053.1 transcriptional repressor [Nitrospina sp.]
MLNEFDLFKDFLRQQNLRWTPQRKMILEVFLSFEGHVEMEALHKQILIHQPDLGIATLYRTLKLLTDCGLIEAHSFQNGKKTYERMFHVRHHDHLICTRCGDTVEFEHPLIEKYQLQICEQYGFTLKHHKMELLGICRNCLK